jgi:hypothetical protein
VIERRFERKGRREMTISADSFDAEVVPVSSRMISWMR